MPSSEQADKSQRLQAGLRGKCPECCEGSLFSGFLKFAPACQACGFDFHKNDIADGPAVFVILIASIFVVPFALAYQIKTEPPIWLTLLVFIPLIIAVCLAMLRPFRGLMFAMQIVNDAGLAEQETQNNHQISHED